MTETAYRALTDYIRSTAVTSESLQAATEGAAEFGVPTLDAISGSVLTLLGSQAARGAEPSAIAVTPAAAVVGLHLFEGMGPAGHLTCIDPELEHQKLARRSFTEAGIAASRFRFLPSRPLEVMGRLATNSYDIVYGDVAPQDMQAFVDSAWPLIRPSGMIIVAASLLDGTVADESRTDRDTAAARALDDQLRDYHDALVTRLPLAGGLSIISKRP